MRTMLDSFMQSLGVHLPKVLLALAILVVGWIVAVLLRALVRRVLLRLGVNKRAAEVDGRGADVAGGVAKGVYVVTLVIAAIASLNALNLSRVADPLQAAITPIMGFLPNLLAAGVLAVVAWAVATLLRTVATKALAATSLDEKVTDAAGMEGASRGLGHALYWLVLLLFLPPILEALGVESLLTPFEGVLVAFFGLLPNLVAAALIGVIGWYLAKLLRNVVTTLLASAGLDDAGGRIGFKDDLALSRLVGILVQVLVVVPALIAAFEALRIAAISDPATAMLQAILTAIPNILAAGIILAIAWIVGRIVVRLVVSALAGLGVDDLPAKLGFPEADPADFRLSEALGKVALVFIMLFATVEAAHRLGFTQAADLVAAFIAFGAQVALGTVILVVGWALARAAHKAILGLSGDNAAFLAGLARVAILGLVVAMGLRAMGIADDIVNIAFGLTLGAVAVAVALSFGLGGREPAGKLVDHWLERFRRP